MSTSLIVIIAITHSVAFIGGWWMRGSILETQSVCEGDVTTIMQRK